MNHPERISFRRLFQAYLIALHVLGFGLAVWFREALGLGFFAIEALLIVSLWAGLIMTRRALAPLEFVEAFSDVLNEKEFSSRFSTVGMAEMDRVIQTYNRMLSELYAERIRVGEQRGFVDRFLAASPVGVVILDFDGRISLVNQAAATHLDLTREPIGRRLAQQSGPLIDALGKLDVGDTSLIRAGTRRIRVQHLNFVDRGFSRSFYVTEELTEILNESERSAYEKLIRMMSHEVNNTVASTNSLLESCRIYADQLNDEDKPDFEEAISVVIRRSEHLNRFMHSFAQVVKLPPPRKERADLRQILQSVAFMFRPQCADRGINLRFDAHSDLTVMLDIDQFEQAIINILKNAIEAIEKNGNISVKLSDSAGQHALLVVDDGPGIDDSFKDQLFSPFATSKPGGQGLGLTLVREILSRHEFPFSLQSESGQTEFRIEFPKAAIFAPDSQTSLP